MRWIGFCLGVIGLLSLAGCGGSGGGSSAESGDGRPTVYTTFYPTTYFAERIGGGAVEVVCPVPADADPAHWQPGPDVLSMYQNADLIVINGAGFEQWVDKVSLPISRVVNTAEPFEDRWLHYEDTVTHTHGPEGEHSHKGLDGHTWLDPVNAKAQARSIKEALLRIAPRHEQAFASNFTALAAELDGLHQRLTELTEQYNGQPLLASHPAYNYLVQRYGWNVKNLDLDPQTMPDDQAIENIRQKMEGHDAEYLIWEAEPKPAVADRLRKELGLKSVVFSPAEMPGPVRVLTGDGGVEQRGEDAGRADPDYLSIMRQNIANIEPALKPSS